MPRLSRRDALLATLALPITARLLPNAVAGDKPEDSACQVTALISETPRVLCGARTWNHGFRLQTYQFNEGTQNLSEPREVRERISPLGHAHYITALVQTASGSRILSASRDSTVKVWTVNSDGALLEERRLKGANRALRCLAVHPNEQFPLAVAGGDDNRLFLWNYDRDMEVLHTPELQDKQGINLNGDAGAQARETLFGKEAAHQFTALTFDRLGDALFAASNDGFLYRFVRSETSFRLVDRIPLPQKVIAQALLAGEHQLVIGGNNGVLYTLTPIKVDPRKWTMTPVYSDATPSHPDGVTALAAGPGRSNWYLSAGKNGGVLKWDWATKEQDHSEERGGFKKIPNSDFFITSLSVNRQGTWAVAGLQRPENGLPLRVFPIPK